MFTPLRVRHNLFAGPVASILGKAAFSFHQLWESLDSTGLYSYDVQALAVRARIFCWHWSSGRSSLTDSGANWTQVNTGLDEPYVLPCRFRHTSLYTYGGAFFFPPLAGQIGLSQYRPTTRCLSLAVSARIFLQGLSAVAYLSTNREN